MAARFKYELILEQLIDAIQTDGYQLGKKLPSAQGIALSFNTSQITANKALNILSAQGYIKRSTGSGSIVINKTGNTGDTPPIVQESQLIGAVVFDISNIFWAGVISGIEEVCQINRFNLLVGNDDGNLKKAELYIRNFIAQGVKGLIFVPIGMEDEESYECENRRLIKIIEDANIPFVLLHRRLNTYHTSFAQMENYYSSLEATRLLLKQGVQNPICISQYFSRVVSERNQGFLDALKEAGFKDYKERILHLHPLGQTVSKNELKELLSLMDHAPKYDGMLTITADMLALVLLVGKHLVDLSDTKIISFDFNSLLFSHRGIIAMLATPSAALGQKSCEILFNKIFHTDKYDTQVTLVPIMHVKNKLKKEKNLFNYISMKKVLYHD